MTSMPACGPLLPFPREVFRGLGASGRSVPLMSSESGCARRSEVKEETAAQPSSGDMSGGGHPPPSAREPLESDKRNGSNGPTGD